MSNRSRASSRHLFGSLVIAAGCATAAPPKVQAPSPTETLATTDSRRELMPREELPDEVLEMLNEKMLRHGEHMMALFAGVLVLDYDFARDFATGIADEPPVARPKPGERDTLSAILPPKFFEYQDALGVSSKALAFAAGRRDGLALVEAFSALTKACVGCHLTYLNDDLNQFEDHDLDVPPRVGSEELSPDAQSKLGF